MAGSASALPAAGKALTHKIAIGDSDQINFRFGPLCGHKSDLSRGPRSADIVAKVRNCPALIFLAVKRSDRRPPIDVASITLSGSPASFSSDDEVPHIFTWKSPVQPKEILIASAKRLQISAYSITSSARPISGSGKVRPSVLAVLRLITNSTFTAS